MSFKQNNRDCQWRSGLTSFQLKIIALVFMTIDHFGRYQTFTVSNQVNDILRLLGRLAAPLFLFLLVEGLRHTRNKKKYTLRLYIAGVLISVGHIVFMEIFAHGYTKDLGNILPTFFYVAFYIVCSENTAAAVKDKKILNAVLPIMGIAFSFLLVGMRWAILNFGAPELLKNATEVLLPSPFTVEYGFIFIVLGVTWYFINNKTINCALFAVLAALSYFVPVDVFFSAPASLDIFRPMHFSSFALFYGTQWCMAFSVPFMLFYNGERGKSLKYLFYVYYPLHQYILFYLMLFVI
jgi:hypothetical protein